MWGFRMPLAFLPPPPSLRPQEKADSPVAGDVDNVEELPGGYHMYVEDDVDKVSTRNRAG